MLQPSYCKNSTLYFVLINSYLEYNMASTFTIVQLRKTHMYTAFTAKMSFKGYDEIKN